MLPAAKEPQAKVAQVLGAVLSNQALQHRPTVSIAKERVMLALGDIHTNDEVILRAPHVSLELMEPIDSGVLVPKT